LDRAPPWRTDRHATFLPEIFYVSDYFRSAHTGRREGYQSRRYRQRRLGSKPDANLPSKKGPVAGALPCPMLDGTKLRDGGDDDHNGDRGGRADGHGNVRRSLRLRQTKLKHRAPKQLRV
jgi:hypothetical protein